MPQCVTIHFTGHVIKCTDPEQNSDLKFFFLSGTTYLNFICMLDVAFEKKELKNPAHNICTFFIQT